MIKNLKRKIVSLIIIISILLCNFSFAANEKSNLQNQKNDIDDKIDEAKENLENVQTDKSEALKAIEELTDRIDEYQEQVDNLDTQIDELNKSIKLSQEKLNTATEQYNNQEELLKERLVALYEAGNTSYLDVLLSSNNVTDFISNYFLVSEIASYDTDLLEKIEKQKTEIENAKKELEESKSKIEIAKKNKQTKANELKAAKTDKDEQVSKLSAEEKQIQSDIDEFEKDKKDIQAQLAAIAKKEAEEAKKREEENKKNNSSNNSGSNSTSDNSNIANNPSKSGFIRPVVGYSITTPFHGYKNHTGCDFSGSGISGKPVLAVKDGTVEISTALKRADGSYKSYGEYIVINHHDGTMTLYAHGAPGSRLVSPGQKVKQGQQIMSVGTTGNSTGYHLHFEVRINGVPVNPAPYLP